MLGKKNPTNNLVFVRCFVSFLKHATEVHIMRLVYLRAIFNTLINDDPLTLLQLPSYG